MKPFLNLLRELLPPNPFPLIAALLLFLLFGAVFAFAQDAAPALVLPPAPSGFWDQAISYGLDVAAAMLFTAGSWIIAQIIRLLNITDAAKRLQVEDALRNIFHFMVENGARFAYAKAGVPLSVLPTPQMIADAMFYVKSNNPDTLVKLGVDDAALERVVISTAHRLASYFSVPIPSSDASTQIPAAIDPASVPAPAA